MISIGESELMCDLAETYGIYNYRSLPPKTVATFAMGLREDARIMMKITKRTLKLETMLLAGILDRLSLLVWQNTEDGQKGENKPESMLMKLMGMDEDENEVAGFNTAEEFEKKRRQLLGGAV